MTLILRACLYVSQLAALVAHKKERKITFDIEHLTLNIFSFNI
jgi:hypothetical protein